MASPEKAKATRQQKKGHGEAVPQGSMEGITDEDSNCEMTRRNCGRHHLRNCARHQSRRRRSCARRRHQIRRCCARRQRYHHSSARRLPIRRPSEPARLLRLSEANSRWVCRSEAEAWSNPKRVLNAPSGPRHCAAGELLRSAERRGSIHPVQWARGAVGPSAAHRLGCEPAKARFAARTSASRLPFDLAQGQ